jgi:preprotein translocase subunit SecD
MRQNYLYNMIGIIILLAVVIWWDLPTTSVNLGDFKRSGTVPFGLDLTGGLQVLLEVPAEYPITDAAMADVKNILTRRSNALGVSEIEIQQAGPRRFVGRFPGLTKTSDVFAVLKETGQLTFVMMGKDSGVNEGQTIQVDATGAMTPPDATIPTDQPVPTATLAPTATATPSVTPTPGGATPTPAPTVYKALMTGAALQSDQIVVTTASLQGYAISFKLKTEWAKAFADYTAAHIGDTLAIVLDGKVISAPVIQNAITDGSGQISGSFTQESANSLATYLRYGALPVPLVVSDSRQVSATLGQDSVNRSVTAGAIGLLMVIIFMIIYYRLPGFLASLALLLYAGITYGLFKLIPVTLTLPGIAGFVLSIGVAVDANILIFSRMKEELKAGRSLSQAIDLGWKRAWLSIRDSNISTLITCFILGIFGSNFGASIVTGFAVTLALGVFVSLFTAIIVTRTLLHVVTDNLEFTKHPRWFGA